MDNNTIDIVIPTYNRSGQLRLAIESALAQTMGGFNLYVLDNCSTDDTEEACAEFKSRGVTYIRNPSNLGMVGNWNRALMLGDAPYLLILHDDDELTPEFLATTVPMIARAEGAAFLHSAATIINRDGKRQFHRTLDLPSEMSGNEFFTRFLNGKMSVICPTVIYNRKVIPSSYRFQEELPFTADLFFFIGASGFGSVLYSDKPYFRYRVHEASTTSSLVKSIDRKIADRVHASAYLQGQADQRAVPNNLKAGAGKSYRLAALTADVWFTRRLGGSYGDVLHVARRTVSAEPDLLCYPRFYAQLSMALLPSAVLRGLAFVKRRMISESNA
ncbi:glycosyltransferase family 2 protein [Roseovarius sp. S4756]|uniref:glycosyltransferase family 2 protein n=1 Tax=Roseovarius maritimus TaxID=3342637 RepID=UPI0037297265